MPAPDSDRRFTLLAPVMLAGWFALLAVSYHRNFPPGTLPAHAMTLLAAAAIFTGAAGLGTLLLRLLLPFPVAAPLSWALALGLGLGGLELAVLAAVVAGAAYPTTGWILLAASLAAAARAARGWREGWREARDSWREAASRWWCAPAVALAGTGWLAALGAALAPADFYDALIYHLAVPARYLQAHAMIAIEGNYYAHFPANQGMLYTLGMLIVRDPVAAGSLAQVLHLGTGAAAVAATFAAGVRHLSARAGVLAACLMATVPGILLVATYPIADLGATLDGALVMAALLEAGASAEARDRRRWILLAGIFAGLALGVKYTTALSVVLPAAVLLLLRARRLERTPIADLGVFALAAVVVFSPWAVRNTVVAGNPVAPYLAGFTGAASSGPTLGEELARRFPDEAGAGAKIGHYLGAPWRVGVERLGAGGYLGVAFALLTPFILMRRGHPPAVAALAVLAGAALAGWSAGVQLTRYLFPALPAVALLAAQGAATLVRVAPSTWEGLACALAWLLLHNLYLFGVFVAAISPFGVVFGVESPQDYLARKVEYYPAADFINTALPATARVLLVGEGRTYYLQRDHAANTPFDPILLEAYAAESVREARRLSAILRDHGFTHLLVSRREMGRIARMLDRDDYFAGADPAVAGAARSLVSGAGVRTVFEKGGVSVLELAGE